MCDQRTHLDIKGQGHHANQCHKGTYVGSVAKWLGRRSMAGGLSLTYTRSMVDR